MIACLIACEQDTLRCIGTVVGCLLAGHGIKRNVTLMEEGGDNSGQMITEMFEDSLGKFMFMSYVVFSYLVGLTLHPGMFERTFLYRNCANWLLCTSLPRCAQ